MAALGAVAYTGAQHKHQFMAARETSWQQGRGRSNHGPYPHHAGAVEASGPCTCPGARVESPPPVPCRRYQLGGNVHRPCPCGPHLDGAVRRSNATWALMARATCSGPPPHGLGGLGMSPAPNPATPPGSTCAGAGAGASACTTPSSGAVTSRGDGSRQREGDGERRAVRPSPVLRAAITRASLLGNCKYGFSADDALALLAPLCAVLVRPAARLASSAAHRSRCCCASCSACWSCCCRLCVSSVLGHAQRKAAGGGRVKQGAQGGACGEWALWGSCMHAERWERGGGPRHT
jgi:hypothetical protein